MPTTYQDQFTLRTFFSGLCAFAPSEEIPSSGKVREVHVLLVNAKEEEKSSLKFSELDDLDEHYPFLVFYLRNLPGGSGLPAGLLGLFPLQFHEIFVQTDLGEAGVQLRSTGATPPEPDPDLPDENTDFCWVPRLEDVSEGSGRIDASLVSPSSTERRIRGCIHLTAGELSSSNLGEGDSSNTKVEFTVHKFVPPEDPDDPVEQVLASEIMWSVSGLQKPVTFRFRQFGQGGLQELDLVPYRREDGSLADIQVKIVNLCAPSVFEYLGARGVSSGVPRADSDFKWFYLLSGGGDPMKNPAFPVPVKFAVNRPDGGGEPQICSGCVTGPPR